MSMEGTGLNISDLNTKNTLTPEEMSKIQSGYDVKTPDENRVEEFLGNKGDRVLPLHPKAKVSPTLNQNNKDARDL